MGIGDDIIATGMARGAAGRGELVAFGDGTKQIWGPYSEMIFRNNPNIAKPGKEKKGNIVWIKYHKGHRVYNRSGVDHWIWNYEFKVSAGEFFFDGPEEHSYSTYGKDEKLVLIEPNVPKKPCGPNKQWPIERWAKLVNMLKLRGWNVCQFEYQGALLKLATPIQTPTFRDAAALMKKARFAILPEGGLHHAAAAVGTRAVVLFGGFVPPEVLGYDSHLNLTGGAKACGSFTRCEHCIEAMKAITVDDVIDATTKVSRPC